MIVSPSNQRDPGRKKPNDAYTSEQNADKIVNEEDQALVSNTQHPDNATNSPEPGGSDQGEEKSQPDALTNSAYIDDSSHHPETATPELIEEERKEDAGINP